MQEVRYSRLKLWVLAVCCAHVAAFMGVLLANPQYRAPGRIGLLLNGGLGHFFILPLVALTSFVAAVRCMMVASGSVTAIATDAEGATLKTIWRSHRLVWSDLLRIRLEATTVRNTKSYSFKFDRCDGRTISLPLAGLTVRKDEYWPLLEKLSETHLSAIKPVAVASPAAHDVVEPAIPIDSTRAVFGRKIR